MSNENYFWKLLTNYFIYLLSLIALYLITAPVKNYIVRQGDPAVFGRIAVIILIGAILGFISNLNTSSSKEMVISANCNRGIFLILMYIGVFFLFVSIS